MIKNLLVLFLFYFPIQAFASETGEGTSPASIDIFDPDHLIQVEVTLSPEDWHELRISHRVTGENFSQIADNPYSYYPAEVVIVGRNIGKVGIRKKGFFGSAVSTRPSLKFKLDKYVEDQEFAGQDMLTFNNNNQDPTRAQSFLVYGFMNEAGVSSPRSNLGRIIVNGEDLGIYTHVESVRKPLIKRLFQKSKGDLWEGFAGDFTEDEYSRIVHKWGKDDDGVNLKVLYDLLQSAGPIALEDIEALIDLDAFITLWASEVLIGHWDGYASNRNNFYIFRGKKSGVLQFIPWGPDSAFADPGPFLPADLPRSFKARGFLCQRLWELPSVRTRYRAEMQRLLTDVWDEQKLLAQLKKVRMLTKPYSTVPDASVRKSSASIIEFIETRRAEVQAELDKPARDWPSDTRSAGVSSGAVMEVFGEFSSVFTVPGAESEGDADTQSLFASVPVSLLGTGSANIEFTVDGVRQQPFTQYGVRTTPGNPDFIRKGYPVIELIATSDSGHPPWRLLLILDPYQLAEGSNDLEIDHFTVWAQLTQGEPGAEDAQTTLFGIAGRLELDAFARKPGAEVGGRFWLKTGAFAKH